MKLYFLFIRKHIFKIIVLFFVLMVGMQSSMSQTTVSSFSPLAGAVGTSVTITGTGFDATASNNTVYFGSVKAIVSSASVTSLTVTVPAGSTYQPVTVINILTGKSGSSNLFFNVTFPAAGAFSISSFAAKVDRATANAPLAIAVGDINGDGLPDVVIVNSGANSVSVFKNTSVPGTISFAAKVDFATANSPSSITLGDYNGDGKLDILVTNSNSNSVSLIRNTSTIAAISFAVKQDLITGTSPDGVYLKDLNADGLPDIVVANRNSNTISVFRNLGGIFAAKVDFATGTAPFDAAIIDIDGDGKPDVVAPDDLSTALSTLRNTSAGAAISFAAKVDNTTPLQPRMVSLGDLDGDGKQDLVTPNFVGNNFSAFRNTSTSGTISYAARQDVVAGTQAIASFISDMDGDGLPDVMVLDASANSVGVYKNTSIPGTISFAAPITYSTGVGPQKMFVADLDLDGKPDIITINSSSNTFSVLRNTLLSSLPLNLLSFTVVRDGSNVNLSWQTSGEMNTDRFEAEHSSDGNNFIGIGNVQASGNSTGIRDYSFTHSNPPNGFNFYRLKMIDIDGTLTYSRIVSIQIARAQSVFSIYPNPTGDYISVKPSTTNGGAIITITSRDGLLVKSIRMDKNQQEIKIPMYNLPAGLYTISLESGGLIQSQTMFKK